MKKLQKEKAASEGNDFYNILLQNIYKGQAQAFDNLFSANHRGLMLRAYGYTEAMRVTVEDLINLTK